MDSKPIEIHITVRIGQDQARELVRLMFSELAIEQPDALSQSDRLLDVNETAEILGISKSSLYSMRYLGDAPPAVKVGSRLRWRRSDLDQWISEQLTEGRGDSYGVR